MKINELFYIGNKSKNIDVLRENMDVAAQININNERLRGCNVVDNSLFICSTDSKKLHKFKMPNYERVASEIFDSWITWIMQLKQNLLVLSCTDGCLILFDYD
mmetsp:Transcript_1759/g.1215  ORF Transcript_1759/g.1215 Transcript_1759/m.1215 type:complete len:103 (+) Transcript_1759:29-337(+)